MKSMIREYQLTERRDYIKTQTQETMLNYEAIRTQIDHLDKFVDLDQAKIMIPLCSMIETKAELDDLLSKKPSTSRLDDAQTLSFVLEAQASSLRQNVEEVLSQGIEFLRLPEFDDYKFQSLAIEETDETEPNA